MSKKISVPRAIDPVEDDFVLQRMAPIFYGKITSPSAVTVCKLNVKSLISTRCGSACGVVSAASANAGAETSTPIALKPAVVKPPDVRRCSRVDHGTTLDPEFTQHRENRGR